MNVVVVADNGRCRGNGHVRATEIIVLIFNLSRPIRREQVLKATAHRVADIVTARGECQWQAGERIGHEHVVVLTECDAPLGVQQRRTPSVAETAGHRAEIAGAVRYREAAGYEGRRAGLAVSPGVLAFDTEDPVRRE